MIALFTDFGVTGPYVGQMKAVLHTLAPTIPVVDLMHDAPRYNPNASAYVLAALAAQFPQDTVFLCVVDPGVGTERRPLMLQAGGRWFVGPDNGLLDVCASEGGLQQLLEITWRPESLSESFHGRDLFAPVSAALAKGESVASRPISGFGAGTPEDLAEIVYIDHYGNALTGMRASRISADESLLVRGVRVSYARTFGCAPTGTPFWYRNSIGLAEIAVNQGSAATVLGLDVGTPIEVCR